MCIAIIKPAGAKLPGKDVIKTCHDNNPHGAGYAWSDGKIVRWDKGYFDPNVLYASMEKNIKPEYPAVIHMRIATHGKIGGGTCHPFPIDMDFSNMRKTEGEAQYILAHNGILHAESSDDVSDTMTFTKLLAETGLHRKAIGNKSWSSIMENAIHGSRVVILRGDGYWKSWGGGWKKDGDYWYSNDGYKPKIYSPYYDRWDDIEWYRKAGKKELNTYSEAGISVDEMDSIRQGVCPYCGSKLIGKYCSDCGFDWYEESEDKDVSL